MMNAYEVFPKVDQEHPPSASQTIDRAIQLVRLISTARGAGLALSELVLRGGMTKPTTRRLLVSLISNGMVEQDPKTRRYHLGPDAYMFGMIASERYDIHKLAAISLGTIASASGDTALLCVQRGMEWICLAREEGSYPLRSHVLQPGDRHPVGAGSPGMAILAALSDSEVDEVLAHNRLQLNEHYPGHTVEVSRLQLAATRREGYALNAGYVIPESWGMAVALRDGRSNIVATLTITAIKSRFSGGRVEQLSTLLKDEARKLELRLASGGRTF